MAKPIPGTSTSSSTSGGTGLTYACTVAEGENFLVVDIGFGSTSSTVSSSLTVTYNGVALTRVWGPVFEGIWNHVEQWYLANPSVGTFDVVISGAESSQIASGATPYSGVDTSDPFGTPATASSTGSGPASTGEISGGSDSIVIGCVFSDENAASDITPDGTQLWEQAEIGGDTSCGGQYKDSAPSTLNWSVGDPQWACGGVALNGASSGVAQALDSTIDISSNLTASASVDRDLDATISVSTGVASTLEVYTPASPFDVDLSGSFTISLGEVSGGPQALSATISASSAVAPQVVVARTLSSSVDSVASLGSDASVLRGLSASVAAAIDVTTVAGVVRGLSSAIAGAISVSSSARALWSLSSVIVAVTGASTTASILRGMSAGIDASSSLSGSASVLWKLASAIAAVSGGTLTLRIPGGSSFNVVLREPGSGFNVTFDGTQPSESHALSAAIAAATGITVVPRVTRRISSSIAAASGGTVVPRVARPLTATVASASFMGGNFRTVVRGLSTSIGLSSGGTATAKILRRLSSAIAATSGVDVLRRFDLKASILAQSAVDAFARLSLPLSTSISSTSSVAAIGTWYRGLSTNISASTGVSALWRAARSLKTSISVQSDVDFFLNVGTMRAVINSASSMVALLRQGHSLRSSQISARADVSASMRFVKLLQASIASVVAGSVRVRVGRFVGQVGEFAQKVFSSLATAESPKATAAALDGSNTTTAAATRREASAYSDGMTSTASAVDAFVTTFRNLRDAS